MLYYLMIVHWVKHILCRCFLENWRFRRGVILYTSSSHIQVSMVLW